MKRYALLNILCVLSNAVKHTQYWRDRNVPGPTQYPLLGTFLQQAFVCLLSNDYKLQ